MKWLLDVITLHAEVLDLRAEESRVLLAESILDALPKRVVSGAIASATGAVLKCRGIADAAGDLAREIGKNAAQTVILMIHTDDGDPSNELAIPEAVAR